MTTNSTNNITGTTTSPQGTSCEPFMETPYTQAFKTLVYILIISVSIIGNSIVIYIVYRNHQERNMTNWFIANLAASDIFIALTGMPNMITEQYVSYWMFGSFVCKMVVYFQSVAVAVSVLTLIAVTGDRYLCVLSPLSRRPGIDQAKYIVLIIWVIALSVMAPLVSAQKVVNFDGNDACIEEWSEPFDKEAAPKHFTVILFVVMYVIPLTGMAILYFLICRTLWKRKAPGEQINQTEILIQKSRRRVVIMLVTVTIVFALCWLPLWVFQFISFFAGHIIPCRRELNAFYFVSLFLGHSNSAINPFLYSLFNKSFRNGFKNASKWLRRSVCCKDNNVAPSSGFVVTGHYTIRAGTGRSNQKTSNGYHNPIATIQE